MHTKNVARGIGADSGVPCRQGGQRSLASLLRAACLLPLLGSLCTGALASEGGAQTGSDITGRWATSGFGSIVEFRPCEQTPQTMCGRILWLWQPNDTAGRPRTDTHNSDRSLRDRPLVGIEIVSGLRETAPGVWGDGSLYNPDDGRTYTGTIRLDSGTLSLTGCALKVFCQTQIWRRPADVLAAVEGL